MDKRFLTAFISPPEWELVGFKLRPFCPRHLILLAAFKSPYLEQGKMPTPAETIHFLRICSHKRPDAFNCKPGFLDTLYAAKLAVNPKYHIEVGKAIANYIHQYSSPPKVVSTKANGMIGVIQKASGDIPSLLVMVSLAMSKLGLSEDEAMDMPVGRLAWYGMSLAIMEGAEMKLITTEEEEMAEDMRVGILKHEAEMAARLHRSMKDGKIPTRIVRTTGQ